MINHLTNTRYGIMLYPSTDQIIGQSLSLYGEWYQAEMDLLQAYIPENGFCIDVGANLGCHTLFFSYRRMDRLDERERIVIALRYGLGGSSPLTLKEIGRRLGVTREWVRKIELRAVRRYEIKFLPGKDLRDFLT